MNKKILIYTKRDCPYCDAAKQLLQAKNAEFEEIDISHSETLKEQMMQKTERKTVPQIFIGDHHVGGFDDLSSLDSEGRLDSLLQGVLPSRKVS